MSSPTQREKRSNVGHRSRHRILCPLFLIAYIVERKKAAKTAILAGVLLFVVYFQVGKAQKKESSKMNGKLFLHQHRLGDVFLHL